MPTSTHCANSTRNTSISLLTVANTFTANWATDCSDATACADVRGRLPWLPPYKTVITSPLSLTCCAADLPAKIRNTCCSTCSFWESPTCWYCAATRRNMNRHSLPNRAETAMPLNWKNKSTILTGECLSTAHLSRLRCNRSATGWHVIRRSTKNRLTLNKTCIGSPEK